MLLCQGLQFGLSISYGAFVCCDDIHASLESAAYVVKGWLPTLGIERGKFNEEGSPYRFASLDKFLRISHMLAPVFAQMQRLVLLC